MQRRARSLGVAGWVRNLPDGSVQAVVEGADERVESMIDWCCRGPRGARVVGVDLAWEEPQGDEGFDVQPSIEGWREVSP